MFLLVYFCGCDRINSETPTSGIKSQSIDTTVNPGDNFYAYSNNNWIEKYGSSIGSLLHKTSREVKVIIEEFASGNFEEGTDERKAGDLYKSFVNMDKRNEIGINPLIKEFARINYGPWDRLDGDKVFLTQNSPKTQKKRKMRKTAK